MSDAFTLKGSADMSQAEADVDAFVAGQGTFTIKAKPEVDQTALDDLGADVPAIDVPVDLGDVDTSGIVEDLDAVGGAADEQVGKVGFLRGALGDLGLTSLGLGAAIQLVSGAITVLVDWFDKLGVKADTTAKGSQSAADSVFGLFDALTTLQSATFDTTSGLGALNEAFRAGIESAHAGDVDKVSEAFTRLNVGFEDLSSVMLQFQTDEAAATAALAVGAGASQEFADALGEAATHGDSVNDSFRSLSDDGMRAFGESVGLTGGDLDTYVAKLDDLRSHNELSADQFVNQLPEGLRASGQALVDTAGDIEQVDDAAENTADTLGHLMEELQKSPEGAAALAEVKAALPDASDAELLQALVDKLASIPDPAADAATALDDVAAPRTATIDTETPEAAAARAELDDAAADRDALIVAEAEPDAADADLDATAAADRTATIVGDAETAQAAADLLTETSRSRIAMIIASAKTTAASSVLTRFKNETRTAVITALAHTAVAERALNHTARDRTSHVTQTVTTTGGGGSGGGGSNRAAPTGVGAAPTGVAATAGPAATAPSSRAAVTVTAPSAPSITVNLQAGVVGNRYDLQRWMRAALRDQQRLGRLAQVPA